MKITAEELASKKQELEDRVREDQKNLEKIAFYESLAQSMKEAGGTAQFEDTATLSTLAGILSTNNIRFVHVPDKPKSNPNHVKS